ncbi:hypothetical protein B9Z55_001268 [Caenorhabditis nigoni]|uniref:Uncharacterized protein n=1 Tax=Caenorhabditis nigoni TaxID=1611254 RepID=A0A2G5VF06_9PELO|nr:hypothetical protein B9Z55_001268 [Caenorhabditis nigoni]
MKIEENPNVVVSNLSFFPPNSDFTASKDVMDFYKKHRKFRKTLTEPNEDGPDFEPFENLTDFFYRNPYITPILISTKHTQMDEKKINRSFNLHTCRSPCSLYFLFLHIQNNLHLLLLRSSFCLPPILHRCLQFPLRVDGWIELK